MKQIPLYGKGGVHKYIIIDNDDFNKVNQFKWYIDNKGYAYREKSTLPRIFIHKFIMGAYPEGKSEIDHINNNKLDNRKENLRFCTSQENRNNRFRYATNKTGYKGVQKHKQSDRWIARIYKNKHPVYLGLFKSPTEANQAILTWEGKQ